MRSPFAAIDVQSMKPSRASAVNATSDVIVTNGFESGDVLGLLNTSKWLLVNSMLPADSSASSPASKAPSFANSSVMIDGWTAAHIAWG